MNGSALTVLTPVVLPRNSCRVKGAGIIIGLSASSGISAGIGRAARIEYRAEILRSGSSDIFEGLGLACKACSNNPSDETGEGCSAHYVQADLYEGRCCAMVLEVLC